MSTDKEKYSIIMITAMVISVVIVSIVCASVSWKLAALWIAAVFCVISFSAYDLWRDA